ncbi:MAG: hypothetical protein HYR83_00590, partial [Planctomycetes bacterium]|nr:hypothetical protein [Planctomycetota bacterium]
GDPESDMAKGAVAGIIVLGGIIGFVLVCVATTGVIWFHRGRRMSRPISDADLRGPDSTFATRRGD